VDCLADTGICRRRNSYDSSAVAPVFRISRSLPGGDCLTATATEVADMSNRPLRLEVPTRMFGAVAVLRGAPARISGPPAFLKNTVIGRP